MDIILCVYACDTIPKYKQQLRKMYQVYTNMLASYPSIKIIYFLGEEVGVVGDNFIHLPGVKNDYLSASYKQFLGLKYIYDNFEFKYAMCIGTDTYVNVKRLDAFLRQFDWTKSLYIGGHGDTRMIGNEPVFFHSGGPGFVITHSCVSRIYHRLEIFMAEWIQLCIKHNIRYLIPACDVGIAYLVKDVAETVHCGNLLFTNCNFKGLPCHPNQLCLDTLISCHNMSLADFDEYTAILQSGNSSH